MKSVRDRYQTDATFHYVVNSMRALISSAQLTPSEVREAAMLACIIEEERRPAAPITEEETERMRQDLKAPLDRIIDFAAKQQAETTRQLLRDSGYTEPFETEREQQIKDWSKR